MPRKRSFVTWGVWKTHHESPELIVVCTSKELARTEAAKCFAATKVRHFVEQVNLLVHCGAHALTNAMYSKERTPHTMEWSMNNNMDKWE